MKINIYAHQRVAYKCGNSGWLVGNIHEGNAQVGSVGLFIPIVPLNGDPEDQIDWAEINEIYLEAEPVEDWMKEYGYLMTKEDYIEYIQSDEFDKNTETGYVSDGEYYFYPVVSYTKNWLMKQPFDYIVRNDNGS